MAKSKKAAGPAPKIAGFTPAEWKQHMNKDEDWTERLDGASEAQVLEVLTAFEHADAEVRGLACNMAYAIGVSGLGSHAADAVGRLAAIAEGDKTKKVRTRARIVHESLAGEIERAVIRDEMPWLGGFTPEAVPAALAALDDPREAVRLQVYMWWTNAVAIPADAKETAARKLQSAGQQEADDVTRRAAQLAHAQLTSAG